MVCQRNGSRRRQATSHSLFLVDGRHVVSGTEGESTQQTATARGGFGARERIFILKNNGTTWRLFCRMFNTVMDTWTRRRQMVYAHHKGSTHYARKGLETYFAAHGQEHLLPAFDDVDMSVYRRSDEQGSQAARHDSCRNGPQALLRHDDGVGEKSSKKICWLAYRRRRVNSVEGEEIGSNVGMDGVWGVQMDACLGCTSCQTCLGWEYRCIGAGS